MKRSFLGILAMVLLWTHPAQAAPPALKEGSHLPGVTLVDQEGRPFRFDAQGDRAIILTFVFSRCAVPTFCPTMSANFRAVQEAVRKDKALNDRVRLVSISIDPAFDTPEVLKRYAEHFALDTSDWNFVTGDPRTIAGLAGAFSVFIDATEGGSIDHSLATAVAGPDGKIRKIWRDNRWTPEEAVKELRLALGLTPR